MQAKAGSKMAIITVTESGTTVVVGDNDVVFINIPGGGEVTIVAEPGGDISTLGTGGTVGMVGLDLPGGSSGWG